MTPTSALSLQRVVRAFGYSAQGIGAAWKQEASFRQEVLGFAVLAPLTVWLQLPRLDTVFLLALMGLVLAAELLNSGLEALVDKTTPENHPLAGKAKDCGSAAVLLTVAVLVMAWLTLAGPTLWALLP